MVGAPNVGKSSLFNALVEQSAALVSPQPGTTRDYLVARIDADGLTVELIDTAGRDIDPPPQSIGEAAQKAAATQHDRADLRLLCLDVTRPLSEWEQSETDREGTIVALTKCDLPSAGPELSRAVTTSSRTGAGLPRLRSAIYRALNQAPGDRGIVAGTAARISDSVHQASAAIGRARQLANDDQGEELVAAELRLALTELGKIVGAIYTDDLLDRIFSRFCIGK